MKDMKNNSRRIFDSYAEFVRLTRILTDEQLSVVRDTLSEDELIFLLSSRDDNGYEEMEAANIFDNFLHVAESEYLFNPVMIRLRLLHGKVVRLRSSTWDSIKMEMEKVDSSFVAMLMDGVVCRKDSARSDYVVLTLGGRA